MSRSSLEETAHNCSDYNPITMALGYGIPNDLELIKKVSCSLCVNWKSEKCEKFKDYLNS